MLKIFSVFDSKANAYMNPIFTLTVAVAIRSFSAAATDPQSDICRHAGDYHLFEIGSFDPSTGILTPATPVHAVATALEFQADALPQKLEVVS